MVKPTAEIVPQNNPVLRRKAMCVDKSEIGSTELAKLIAHMRLLLAQEKNGVGLAAPQVGVPVALFIVAGRVFDESNADEKSEPTNSQQTTITEPHPKDKVFINPEMLRMSRKKKALSEGCLSVRGAFGTVLRHEKASVRALDETGKVHTHHGTGLLAHVFQHEMDHLNGILFIDKAVTLEDESQQASSVT